MKRRLSAALMALCLPAAASAADLPARMAAAPVSAIPVLAWNGFYVGVNGGFGGNSIGQDIVTTNIANARFLQSQGFAPDGGFAGGQVGYNWQLGGVVLGVEADIQKSWIRDSFNTTIIASGGNPFAVQASQDIDYFGTVRARLGFAAGPWLFYGTGGFAYGRVATQHFQDNAALAFSVPLQESKTKTGYAVGAGFEWKFAGPWSLKGEYQYIDLGKQNLQTLFQVAGAPVAGNLVVTNDIRASFHTGRIGINYAF